MGIALRQEGIRNGACVKIEAKEKGKNKEQKTTKYRQAGIHDGAKEATCGLKRKDWTIDKR